MDLMRAKRKDEERKERKRSRKNLRKRYDLFGFHFDSWFPPPFLQSLTPIPLRRNDSLADSVDTGWVSYYHEGMKPGLPRCAA